MAIPLLLMRADFRTIIVESGPMLIAFVLAAGATVVGAITAAQLIDMGPLHAEIAGTITSSYIGGSLNFVATAEAVGIKDSSIYVAALSADAVGAVIFLLLLMLMPAVRFIREAMPSKFVGVEPQAAEKRPSIPRTPREAPFRLPAAANGLALSLVICAASWGVASLLGAETFFILIVTTLALLAANFAKPLVRRVESGVRSLQPPNRGEGHSRGRGQSGALAHARSVEGEPQITRVNRARRS